MSIFKGSLNDLDRSRDDDFISGPGAAESTCEKVLKVILKIILSLVSLRFISDKATEALFVVLFTYLINMSNPPGFLDV